MPFTLDYPQILHARWLRRRFPELVSLPHRLALVLVLLLLSACAEPEPAGVLELHGRTMGTSYSVQLANLPPDVALDVLHQAIEAELMRINAQMSTYDPNSDLSRFNQSSATDWIAVPPELAVVSAQAQRVSQLSHGAFDVTVGGLVNLWGFGPSFRAEQAPTPEEIAQQLAVTGYDKLAVRHDPPALRKTHPRVSVDLSAIAKGYAVDRLAKLLNEHKITDYLIEVGGELRAAGQHPERPWRIAIERPESGQRGVFRILSLHDISMATSGDYRNFFEQDGVLYSHTIDPHQGRPVDHRLASVTVLDESCMRADAWATALLVLGPKSGLALAEEQDIAAFFIERLASGYRADRSSAFDRLTADRDSQ